MIDEHDVDEIITAIRKVADEINTNKIDQNYFKEIFELVNMKGNEGYKTIRIYWNNRRLSLPVGLLHHIECGKHSVIIHISGEMIIIPYRNIDFVRLG